MHDFYLRYASFPETDNAGWMSRLRYWRNEELKASDWTQVEDAPVDKIAWANYRQALRDLPSTVTDPLNIVFPQPPSGGN
jgi:hypothetical protein